MAAKLTSASFEMGIRSQPESPSPERPAGDRFNIVLLGDFTGRANRGLVEPMTARKTVPLDVDNFDRVLGGIGAELELPDPTRSGATVEFAFTSLEDFHPDHLIRQSPSLASVVETLRLLRNPKTAEQGKEALQAILRASRTPPSPSATEPSAPVAESDDDTMARLLGGAAPTSSKSPTSASRFEEFIHQVVAPHVTPDSASWQPAAVASAETRTGKSAPGNSAPSGFPVPRSHLARSRPVGPARRRLRGHRLVPRRRLRGRSADGSGRAGIHSAVSAFSPAPGPQAIVADWTFHFRYDRLRFAFAWKTRRRGDGTAIAVPRHGVTGTGRL